MSSPNHAAAATQASFDDSPLDWALIPQRPRTAFWRICVFCGGRGKLSSSGVYLIEAVTPRGTQGWRLMTSQKCDRDVIGGTTINVLVGLELIAAPAIPPPPCPLITNRGYLTWKQFLERGGRFP